MHGDELQTSILRACLNGTHVSAQTYAASPNCGGSFTTSIFKIFETSACVPQASCGGGSSATACVTSNTPYIPPASEPNYAYLFGPGGCTGATSWRRGAPGDGTRRGDQPRPSGARLGLTLLRAGLTEPRWVICIRILGSLAGYAHWAVDTVAFT